MNWYKLSKLVDEKQITLFHGTGNEFDNFDLNNYQTFQRGDWGRGIYFDPNYYGADYYRKESNKLLNQERENLWELYKKETSDMKTISGSPQYSEKALQYIKEFQELSQRIDKDEKSGRVIAVVLDPNAKIGRHYVYPGSITDSFLADNMKDKGYDAVAIYNADTDGYKGLSEVVVMNMNMIKQISYKKE